MQGNSKLAKELYAELSNALDIFGLAENFNGLLASLELRLLATDEVNFESMAEEGVGGSVFQTIGYLLHLIPEIKTPDQLAELVQILIEHKLTISYKEGNNEPAPIPWKEYTDIRRYELKNAGKYLHHRLQTERDSFARHLKSGFSNSVYFGDPLSEGKLLKIKDDAHDLNNQGFVELDPNLPVGNDRLVIKVEQHPKNVDRILCTVIEKIKYKPRNITPGYCYVLCVTFAADKPDWFSA